jgi:proline dehydrogenase
MNISFEDTKTAFAYKTDKELKLARFLFASMRKKWLIFLGLKITPLALKLNLPLKGLIRKTIFRQFVGGETLQQTSGVAERLGQFHVQVILDYGVEGKEGEGNFEKVKNEFIKVIGYSAAQPNIPFMSVKMTGFSRFGLLEKLNGASVYEDIIQGKLPLEILTDVEKKEWQKIVHRLQTLCEIAQQANTGVLIDAEESWIQAPIDALTMQMMQRFNIERPVIYNTAQLYRNDRLQFVKESSAFAKDNNFKLGMKLVRGAYLEKERGRAKELNYPSPINETKQETDNDYNAALEFCVNPVNNVYTIVGSHNEYSNLYGTELMKKFGIPLNSNRIHFSQLFGMSDNITFNLAKAGCSVSKYLPFGPIKEVIPYLMRRAQENSSVSGQTGKELLLIEKELKRRRLGNLDK